ncbi:MAG: DUF433 domain-containing protein [Chloroflexota bacterium]
MIHTPAAVAVPLRTDEHGVIRISQTRVTLVTVINRYKAGDSIETLHESFDAVSLSELYAVIAYYLANQVTIDDYIKQIEDVAQQTKQDWENRYTDEQTERTKYFRQAIAQKKDLRDA